MYIKGIAFDYGYRAQQEGKKRIPAHDEKFLKDIIAGLPVGAGGAQFMQEWLDGWDKANLSA